ncbi:MAG TPA: 2-oxoacid:acceptor oxidoreductase family protein [Selenomonadales bacterium]|nr:2-oxoacid:acceptor oxidoreductase family protein [Selenomonadales bacterium]
MLKEIRWHGRGGQGGFTAARLLGMAGSLYDDYYVQAFPSFGPERRGAPVLGFTRIDTQPIHDRSKVYSCDYVVVLDESLLDVVDVREGIKKGGVLLINSERRPEAFGASPDYEVFTLWATGIALEILGQPVTNTAMFGALVAVSGAVSLEAALTAVELTLPQELWEKNKKAVETAYHQLRR